jgi:hypothetical protein
MTDHERTGLAGRLREANERVLDDEYPVYAGYLYVADGSPISSDVQGTVRDLKRATGAQEIKNCDISFRKLWERAL